MDIILRVISLLSIPLTVFMIFMLIRRTGQEQPSHKRTYVIGIVMPCLMMVINLLFMLSAFIAWCPAIWLVVLLMGGGFGYLQGKSAKMYHSGDTLMVKRSVMHLVFWAISYSLTHFLVAALPAYLAAGGLATMFFSTGSSIGLNSNLILRQNRLALEEMPEQAFQPAPVRERVCPNCQALVAESKYRFCIRCGQSLV